MTAWDDVYQAALAASRSVTYAPAYFRGHADAEWPLLPALARVPPTDRCKQRFASEEIRERVAFNYFRIRAGELLPTDANAWHIVYAMQHYGLPTRLLDWTTTFSIALHFALSGTADRDAAVWVLDGCRLNNLLAKTNAFVRPELLEGTYEDYFVMRTKAFPAPAVALAPPRHNPRIFSQRGAFTLHGDLEGPLEKLAEGAVTKITIPLSARRDAFDFLYLAGISEFAIFPDLDGLARELRQSYFAACDP